MKPPPFTYLAPTSLDEALAMRAEHADDSAVLAGGQSLMPLLNLRMAFPGAVIDLGRVPELAGIREHGGGVAIGAMTRQREVERNALVRDRFPLVGRALRHVGHPAIRNRGTIGGSIAHADPAAELPAVALTLDAELVARSRERGERVIAAADFFAGFLTTTLAPDELLVEVRLPALPAHGAAFVELARRHGDFALVGAGAVVARNGGGALADVRLSLIGVAGTAVRAHAAEAMLRGTMLDADTLDRAAASVAGSIDPSGDTHASAAYRRRVAGVLTRRVLEEAVARHG